MFSTRTKSVSLQLLIVGILHKLRGNVVNSGIELRNFLVQVVSRRLQRLILTVVKKLRQLRWVVVT